MADVARALRSVDTEDEENLDDPLVVGINAWAARWSALARVPGILEWAARTAHEWARHPDLADALDFMEQYGAVTRTVPSPHIETRVNRMLPPSKPNEAPSPDPLSPLLAFPDDEDRKSWMERAERHYATRAALLSDHPYHEMRRPELHMEWFVAHDLRSRTYAQIAGYFGDPDDPDDADDSRIRKAVPSIRRRLGLAPEALDDPPSVN